MRRKQTELVEIEAHGSHTAIYSYGPDHGPSILAIHGFRGTHYGLEPLAIALGSLGYRVLVPDLPGAGASTPLIGVHDAAGYGAWLGALTAQLPPTRLLLGHSFGSVIVSSAIAQGAEHQGAVLINPILQPPLNGPRRVTTAAVRAYYALAGSLPAPLGNRLLASRFLAGIGGSLMTSTSDPALRKWIREEHLRQAGAFASRDVVLESYAASTATTVADFANRITRPALVLSAERDPLSPPGAHTAEATGLVDGSFHVFPDRGHLLPYEEVHAISRLIADWDLSQFDPGAAESARRVLSNL